MDGTPTVWSDAIGWTARCDAPKMDTIGWTALMQYDQVQPVGEWDAMPLNLGTQLGRSFDPKPNWAEAASAQFSSASLHTFLTSICIAYTLLGTNIVVSAYIWHSHSVCECCFDIRDRLHTVENMKNLFTLGTNRGMFRPCLTSMYQQ